MCIDAAEKQRLDEAQVNRAAWALHRTQEPGFETRR